jgi:ABC-type Fe3+ transport system substrate-binding protein
VLTKLNPQVLLALLLWLWAGPVMADVSQFPSRTRLPEGADTGPRTLTLYAAADLEIMRPLLEGFQAAHPDIAIVYHDLNTMDLYQRVIREAESGLGSADVALSSAMDLQIKLVNDGYAQALSSLPARRLPEWAVWRYEAFGFTYEPVVLVYNNAQFRPDEVPRTRHQLIRLLKEQADRYRGRVATYDPERSGVGYLFATQDTQYFQDFWELANAFGAVDAQLYASTGAMLERIADGRLVLGYNLLGSYARSFAEQHPNVGVILLEDYTLIMSRIAVVPRTAPNPALAETFVDFLLGTDGQRIVESSSRLYSIHPDVLGKVTARRLRTDLKAALRPIRVGPGLLVYLDQAKRRRFFSQWRRALARP